MTSERRTDGLDAVDAAIRDFTAIGDLSVEAHTALHGAVMRMEELYGPCKVVTNPVNDWITLEFGNEKNRHGAAQYQMNISVRINIEDDDESVATLLIQ